MINTTGQTLLPGGVDPNTGMVNTTGAPLLPGQSESTQLHGAALHHGTRSRARFGYRLPPPPPSARGRVIISVSTQADPEQPGALKYVPYLDGNMGFLLHGNEDWLSQATLNNLMAEVGSLLALQAVPRVAPFNFFQKFVAGGFLWFLLMAFLMFESVGPDASVPPIILPVCGFGGVALLAVCSFSNMRARQRELLQGVNNLYVACQTFAENWTRSSLEQGRFQLSFRSRMTSSPYFELSPSAPGAEPSQAMAPGVEPSQAMRMS